MTMESNSVFSSDITRGRVPNTKDLYNLINIVPAVPVKPHVEPVKNIDFQPKIGKLYVPKKKSKHKVKTVRNIRFLYESDVLSFLPQDLEKQHNYLLRKFKKGSAQKASTKAYAESLLKSNRPISRQSWQMLMNANPNNKLHSIQYVLWNGVPIRVNGSKGGKSKYLCKYDLGRNTPLQNNFPSQQRKFLGPKNKQKLLENSVNVKFKPGPLSKKKYLDESYQKHQIGRTELVKLPKPILDIYPSSYGITFDLSTRCVLNSLRNIDGEISENWAALATTALGSVKNGKLEKSHPGCCISFELNYKKNQKKILMRKDCYEMQAQNEKQLLKQEQDVIESAVRGVINALLDSVEISLQQDILTFDEDDIREIESNTCTQSNTKEKTKKKFSELDRLHVTVIELPNETSEEKTVKCENSFCRLGCICSSLECRKILRRHCGRLRCMFSCKCDHSMYNVDHSNTEILNELVNLDKQICSKLTKEEQKFHQTVVFSGEQSILLKSNRRDSKVPKKYDDFYSNIKNKMVNPKLLSVASFKIDCANVEPWCMVHNLYKCFCGGKFVDGFTLSTDDQSPLEITADEEQVKLSDTPFKRERKNTFVEKDKSDSKTSIDSAPVYTIDNDSSSDSFEQYFERSRCSRFIPYAGRKYNDVYYTTTNFKIRSMEQNDKTLHKRLMSLVFKNETHQEPPAKKQKDEVFTGERKIESKKDPCGNQTVMNDSTSDKADTPPPSICIIDSDTDTSLEEQKEDTSTNNLNNEVKTITFNDSKDSKSNLIKWLENSYKVYKKRLEEGIVKNSLDPPKQGIMALYPWEFLLTRYRESKNLFLVTKTKPYRIFMAVSMKHPFFNNCINIDDIRFTDLHQYPITVKNLLTNVTNLVDHFYIFRGLSFCWELIGSVSKINEKNKQVPKENENENEEELEDNSRLTFEADDKEDSNCATSEQFSNFIVSTGAEANVTQTQLTESNDSSKWFVMTLENDFSEIQFYKKGFFVKYDSIIKAIRVARLSGNTVRLSSKKCLEKDSIPPFGIHAIPSTDEYLVFIGPYEKDEPLGIETINKILDVKKSKRTRGVWITTNKIDNLKVIKKPLAFMPAKGTNQIVQLHDTDETKSNKTSDFQNSPAQKSALLTRNLNNKNTIMDALFSEKSTSSTAPDLTFISESREKFNFSLENITLHSKNHDDNLLLRRLQQSMVVESESKDAGTSDKRSTNDGRVSKPIAEIAPQIKIIPESQKPTTSRKPEIGMFILKPEEINKKAMENHLLTFQNDLTNENDSDGMSADIEDFLATSIVCAPPNNLKEDDCSNVWIECITVNSLGCIPGRQRSDGFLSIEFPGFKESPFYAEDVAFAKLNQVLERKVFIPKDLCLKWRVVTDEKDLNSKLHLKQDHLGPDFILTKRGLRHKRAFLPTSKKPKIKPYVTDTPSIQTLQPDVTEDNSFEEIEDDLPMENE